MKWSISVGASRRPGPRYPGPWHLWAYPHAASTTDGQVVLDPMGAKHWDLPKCGLEGAKAEAEKELATAGIGIAEWLSSEDWGSVWYAVGESP